MKRKKKNKYMMLIITSLFFSIIISLFIIYFYSNRVTPIIKNYSEIEIKRLLMNVINISIKEVNNEYDVNDLFDIKYSSSGEIILIDFDYKKSTNVLGYVTKCIEKNIMEIEEGNVGILANYYSKKDLDLLASGIVLEVPIGVIMGNNFFNNIGPRIPVKISFVRELETGFSTEVEEYGINNALLKLNLDINMSINIVLPIIEDNMDVNFNIPISIKVIQGKIPNYYLDGFTTNSNIVKGS